MLTMCRPSAACSVSRLSLRAWAQVCLLACTLAIPGIASAAVECNVNPQQYFVGDDGVLWVVWKEGGAGIIWQTDPDYKPTLAAVMAGLLANRPMTVRYADGSSCTGSPVLIAGIWLR